MNIPENRKTNSNVKITCCQFEPIIGDKSHNISRSIELIHQAANDGAQLIVLPELCNTGYVFESKEEATELAESIKTGETIKAWEVCARELNIHIAAGFSERDGESLYNSSILIGPTGVIGSYRKVHLWDEEKLYFKPGNMGVPVYNTDIGKIALLICYDVWFPESFRLCALGGADIVAVPTNWVPLPDYTSDQLPMVVHLCIASAHSNGVFIAAADRIGKERGTLFLGHSFINSPSGKIQAGPASLDKEEIVMATCNLKDVAEKRILSKRNHVLDDRREEVYHPTIRSELQEIQKEL